jgi:hypothetical protein
MELYVEVSGCMHMKHEVLHVDVSGSTLRCHKWRCQAEAQMSGSSSGVRQ